MEDVIKELASRLSIEVDTSAPAYTGNIYLNVTLKLDGEVIATDSTSLPDIQTLKDSEYNDY